MAEEPPSSVNVMGDTTAVADYDFLDACVLPLDRSNAPFIIPWLCTPETRSCFRSFTNISEWRAYILGLGLDGGVCQPVVHKFHRALKLYFLAWLDGDLIKAAEFVALTALELALRDIYSAQIVQSRSAKKRERSKSISLRDLLKHLVEKEGLTDDRLSIVQKYDCIVVRNLYEPDEEREARLYEFKNGKKVKRAMVAVNPMTLDEIRNRAAHGDPFDTAPWVGLFEVVRDLIHYAYRERIAEWQRLRAIHGDNLEAMLEHLARPSDEEDDF